MSATLGLHGSTFFLNQEYTGGPPPLLISFTSFLPETQESRKKRKEEELAKTMILQWRNVAHSRRRQRKWAKRMKTFHNAGPRYQKLSQTQSSTAFPQLCLLVLSSNYISLNASPKTTTLLLSAFCPILSLSRSRFNCQWIWSFSYPSNTS